MTTTALQSLRLALYSSFLAAAMAAPAGAAAGDASGAAPVDWTEVLGPPQGTVPPPRPAPETAVELATFRQSAVTKIPWESDLGAALETARKENRPVRARTR